MERKPVSPADAQAPAQKRDPAPDSGQHSRRGGWRRFVPLVLIGLAIVAAYASGLTEYLSFATLARHRDQLSALVAGNWLPALFAYGAVYALIVALSLPGGAILTITGGFLFGLVAGTIATVLGATLGAVGIFLAARTAFGEVLRARAGPWLKRLEGGFRDHALSYLLVLRLVPVFPFWLVNLVPAFLGVGLRTYVIGTLLGIIPGSFVYVSIGNGLDAVFARGEIPDLTIIFSPDILIPILGLSVLAMLPVVFRKWKNRKAGLSAQDMTPEENRP